MSLLYLVIFKWLIKNYFNLIGKCLLVRFARQQSKNTDFKNGDGGIFLKIPGNLFFCSFV